MNGLEIQDIYGNLIERWVLKNGVATPEKLSEKDFDGNSKPLYARFSKITPENGSEYLNKLADVVDRASYLVAKPF